MYGSLPDVWPDIVNDRDGVSLLPHDNLRSILLYDPVQLGLKGQL